MDIKYPEDFNQWARKMQLAENHELCWRQQQHRLYYALEADCPCIFEMSLEGAILKAKKVLKDLEKGKI